LAINAKGGEFIGPKQKDRTTTTTLFFQKLFHKGEEIVSVAKTLLTAKRRTSWELLFSQREKHLKQGRIFQKT
jgi:hypothetical protein